ncbi:MAG: cysteine--tRNA ligase [Pseudobdellovibrionaceae bacterium]
MSTITLYNSLTRQNETFTPLDEAHVRLYACGPTVYDYAHLGNARMAVIFDVLVRLLKSCYPKVTYVSNITDVDDKIMAAAKGGDIAALTEKYTAIYNEDMGTLGCAAPDIQPRATTHITDMIALIEEIITQGHAYVADGHVLFDVPSFPAYGGLSGRSRDEQIAGARVEVASFKKDPADFVLWKPSAPDQPGWDSPWGRGRPGWHIECSAMAEKHLGLPFDIHGGGADLKFPHHENEIAQSCCAHGIENDLSAFAKMWVHNGFLTVEGEKMSKSLGNFTLAHDLLEKGIKGEVIRMALLSAHYRKPLDWSEELATRTQTQLEGFYAVIQQTQGGQPVNLALMAEFEAALSDDLNTPLAFSVMHKAAKASEGTTLKAMGALVNLLQDDPANWSNAVIEIDQEAEELLAQRQAARSEKDWARADALRDQLLAKGLVIKDTASGPVLEKA